MAFNYLFQGMEAYLDDDVEINNNVTTPEDDAVAAADQSAEIASDVAEANSEAKDSEIQAQMLVQMSKLYTHVKQFGIDRTFVALYNDHGALDQVCNIRFPSCESMPAEGSPSSKYSQAFIAAMEDEKIGLWTKIKNLILNIWDWIVEKAANLRSRIMKFGIAKIADLEKTVREIREKYSDLHPIDISRMRVCRFFFAQETRNKINKLIKLLKDDFKESQRTVHNICVVAGQYLKKDTHEASNLQTYKDELASSYANICQSFQSFNKLTQDGSIIYPKKDIGDNTADFNELLNEVEEYGAQVKTDWDDIDGTYDALVGTASDVRKIIKDIRNTNDLPTVFAESLANAMKSARYNVIVFLTFCRFYGNMSNEIDRELHMPLFLKQLQKK